MRFVTVVLVALLGLVHAELWLGRGGVPRVRELESRLAQQRADNAAARARNDRLVAEVRDLKEGLEMVEERARYELGMVRPDEILVQYTSAPVTTPAAAAASVPSFAARGPVAPTPRAMRSPRSVIP